MQGGTFAMGDFLYSVTTKFVTWSTEFCPLQSVGAAIDSAAATFGERVLGSPLLAGIIVLAIAGLLLQGVRREGGWLARLVVKMIIVAIFVIMILGASRSTTTPSGEYVPGDGSPGWFATTIDEAITEIASAPAAALNAPSTFARVGVDGDQLSCGAYVEVLRRGYEESADRTNTIIKAKSVPAQTISNLWQVSGYQAWSVSQFGRDNLNGQNRVACRMLDHNAGIPAGGGSFAIEGQGAVNDRSAATCAEVMTRVPERKIALREVGINPQAPAWRPLNRVEQDKAWIAWAACVPKGGLLSNLGDREGWHTPQGQGWLLKTTDPSRRLAEEGNSPLLSTACHAFFNTTGEEVFQIFDWGDGDGELKKVSGLMPASIYDFISALHGTNQGASTSAMIGYVLSAIGVAAVFGSIGVTIMIVKAVAAFMLLSAVFVALLCLLPGADNNRLTRFVKICVGLSLTAAFAVFILSLITLLTNVILNVIKGFTGPNSDMTLIIGGLAPVMAAIALHFAFQKAGMPSPLSVKGAMAWGGALSGGAGLGAIRSGGHQIVQGGRDMVHRARDRLGRGQDTTADPARLGKRNSELDTDQPLAPKRAVQEGPVERSPEDILNDPNSTPAQEHAAKKRRLSKGVVRAGPNESVPVAAASEEGSYPFPREPVVLGGPESTYNPKLPEKEQQRRRDKGLARAERAFDAKNWPNKNRAGSIYMALRSRTSSRSTPEASRSRMKAARSSSNMP